MPSTLGLPAVCPHSKQCAGPTPSFRPSLWPISGRLEPGKATSEWLRKALSLPYGAQNHGREGSEAASTETQRVVVTKVLPGFNTT